MVSTAREFRKAIHGRMGSLPLLVVAAGMIGGCDEPVEEDEVLERAVNSACGAWRCGFNAAEVNGRSLQNMRLYGESNGSDVRVVGYVPPLGSPLGSYTLAVEDDELVAKRGGTRYTRQQLVGGIMMVRVGNDLPLPVTIAGTEMVDSWAQGGAPVAAYTLLYPEPKELLGSKNVCSGSLTDGLTNSATVLGGETYDGVQKTVNSGMSGWFTLACAGSAAAKMKLMGYGPQSPRPNSGSAASVAERQATLKMITADYCGTGQSYTHTGTPVVWANREGTVDNSNYNSPGQIEAVWNEHGALCLENKRIADSVVGCELPSCEGLTAQDGMWMTHVALPD